MVIIFIVSPQVAQALIRIPKKYTVPHGAVNPSERVPITGIHQRPCTIGGYQHVSICNQCMLFIDWPDDDFQLIHLCQESRLYGS
jgi:hypothetical protein